MHLANAVWIGRYLGIPGVLLILASSGYSMRKRKLIKSGKPADLRRWHERLAWAGSLLVLVHAGIHFNAILAWLAVWAMLRNVASGLTGEYLLGRSRIRLEAARSRLRAQGLSAQALEEQTYWDSLTFDVVKAWRIFRLPLAAGLVLGYAAGGISRARPARTARLGAFLNPDAGDIRRYGRAFSVNQRAGAVMPSGRPT